LPFLSLVEFTLFLIMKAAAHDRGGHAGFPADEPLYAAMAPILAEPDIRDRTHVRHDGADRRGHQSGGADVAGPLSFREGRDCVARPPPAHRLPGVAVPDARSGAVRRLDEDPRHDNRPARAGGGPDRFDRATRRLDDEAAEVIAQIHDGIGRDAPGWGLKRDRVGAACAVRSLAPPQKLFQPCGNRTEFQSEFGTDRRED
jgi:hypothetical protein